MNAADFDLKRYLARRAILKDHQNAAVETIPLSVLRAEAKRFGMLHGNKIEIASDEELVILYDHCLYGARRRGKTAAERYLAGVKPASADEADIFRAMASPRYSLFEIVTRVKGVGVELADLIYADTLFVVDRNLSKTLKSDTVLAGRVLRWENYWTTAGAAFPTTREVAAILGEMIADELPADPAMQMTPAIAEKIEATILEVGFNGGGTDRVGYR